MKIKAQNTIEIIALVLVVAVVGIAAMMFINGRTANVADLSKIQSTAENAEVPVNSIRFNARGSVSGNNTETAGTLSNTVLRMSKSELAGALSSVSRDDIIKTSSSDDKNIITLANMLIEEYDLPVGRVKADDADLIEKLVNVLETAKETASESAVYKDYVLLLSEITD